jgi:hypothetical protein
MEEHVENKSPAWHSTGSAPTRRRTTPRMSCRGAWARVTIDRTLKRWALQTLWGDRASTNMFSAQFYRLLEDIRIGEGLHERRRRVVPSPRRRSSNSSKVFHMHPCMFCIENHYRNIQGGAQMTPPPKWLASPPRAAVGAGALDARGQHLGETGPLSQRVQEGRNAVRTLHILVRGMEVHKKSPRGFE